MSILPKQTEAELIPWLICSRMEGLMSSVGRRVLLRLGGPGALPQADDRQLLAWGLDSPTRTAIADWRRHGLAGPAARQAQHDLQWLQLNDAGLIHWGHPQYPERLREIHASPPVLYFRGDASLLTKPQLAVVGSRRASANGRELARQLAGELAAAGLVITSGMARGIDAAAHRGTLRGGGKTIAVLGTGLDIIYPRGHGELAEAIASAGLLLSEFSLGSGPTRLSFPQRNRIISGLALGVLVVEASARSGSLITARYAVEQNREVFAVPGAVQDPGIRGCHQLLRQGARLVECAEHVLEELESQFSPSRQAVKPVAEDTQHCLPLLQRRESRGSPADDVVHHRRKGASAAADKIEIPADLDPSVRLLLELIGFAPTPTDVAIARSRLSPAAVGGALAELELLGLVERTPHGYRRCGGSGS